MEKLKGALRALTIQSLSAMVNSSFGLDGFRNAVAYFDSRKDEVVTGLESFGPALETLGVLPALSIKFGAGEAKRIAIQFVFNACGELSDSIGPEAAFEGVWDAFVQELNTPTWKFVAVANLQNIECSDERLDIVDGISIRARSFEQLARLLNWGPGELDYLTRDWMAGSSSSFVILAEKIVPKTLENFLFSSDGTEYMRVRRALLALRLLMPGDVRVGRLFMARPSAFNVGLGGLQSVGFSVWHPGTVYKLTADRLPQIRQLYQDLSSLEQNPATARNLALALRSFSSIYDRYLHQPEDRILDAITALEALWKLDQELSFRLAFRTAALLATTADERV